MAPRIRSITGLPLRLPFHHWSDPPQFAGRPRTTLDSLLVRVELDSGLVGWGEAYGGELQAVQAVLSSRVAPLAIGREVGDADWAASLDRTLHNLGRSGVLQHALSGLDIALWDLRGKLASQSLADLLGGRKHGRVQAYASLLQYYGDVAKVRANVGRAVDAGFLQVKLHERTPEAVHAARTVLGPDLPLMVDTNCAWDRPAAIEAMRAMASSRPLWIEEPIWPPENLHEVAAARYAAGLPVAAGENASSVHELLAMVDGRVVDYVQPCAIKSGGVSTLLRLFDHCRGTSVRCSPQTAFFGPGFLATLQVLAAQEDAVAIERLYCELGVTPYAGSAPLRDGWFTVPDGPGLGADPEPSLLSGPFVEWPRDA